MSSEGINAPQWAYFALNTPNGLNRCSRSIEVCRCYCSLRWWKPARLYKCKMTFCHFYFQISSVCFNLHDEYIVSKRFHCGACYQTFFVTTGKKQYFHFAVQALSYEWGQSSLLFINEQTCPKWEREGKTFSGYQKGWLMHRKVVLLCTFELLISYGTSWIWNVGNIAEIFD